MGKAISLTLIMLLAQLLVTASEAGEIDFSNAALTKVRKEAAEIIASKKPTSERVLGDENYFLEQFRKTRTVEKRGRKVPGAMEDTDNKLIVCVVLARAMFKLVEEHGSDSAATLLAKWKEIEKETLDALAEENTDGQAALTEKQRNIWGQFFEEWRNDVEKADPERFKDALLQAAYEITKAGMGIQEGQEARAKSKEATPQGSPTGGTAATGSTAGGYYLSDVIHERKMNHIYRTHNRRMNRIRTIRARTGRY